MEDEFWAQQRNITDPIHGSFDLPMKLFDIIDTPQFQRLRDIKQLGTCQYVYPGAVSTRFIHCIGTAYLAKRWVHQFRTRQPELEISEELENLVTTAGLVHDIGHSVQSHVFEHWMHQAGHADWNHEHMGGLLFEHIIDTRHLDWERSSIRMVQDLVLGKVVRQKPWLSQIVANHETGIDVDKFDYIERDCHHLGLKSSFQSNRLMEHSRVIGKNIAFLRKEAWNIYELFMSRFSLHRRAYQHRISSTVDHMMFDVFSNANSHLRLAEWAQDVSRYHLLTDSLLGVIRQSTAPELSSARDILNRLDNRDLYPLAAEFLVSQEHLAELNSLSAQEIVNCQPTGAGLAAQDIILHKSHINFGKGTQNPVSKVKFYSKANVSSTFSLERSDICSLLPATYQEDIVRVFVRSPKHLDVAKAAVAKLIKRRHLNVTLTSKK